MAGPRAGRRTRKRGFPNSYPISWSCATDAKVAYTVKTRLGNRPRARLARPTVGICNLHLISHLTSTCQSTRLRMPAQRKRCTSGQSRDHSQKGTVKERPFWKKT